MGADTGPPAAGTGGNATTNQMIRLSAFIFGGRFVYITVFVFNNGVLQNRGVSEFLTAVSWSIAGPTGLILIYLFGAWSDSCTSPWGRRRPFLLITAIFLCIGLFLVPFGEPFVQLFDPPDLEAINTTQGVEFVDAENYHNGWAIALTLIGAIILYKFLKLCWSPSRAYMADATNNQTYARGMSIFTIMSSVGSFLGGIFGYIDWEKTFVTNVFEDEFEFVYLVTVIIMIISTIVCLTSYKEKPLGVSAKVEVEKTGEGDYTNMDDMNVTKKEYKTFEDNEQSEMEKGENEKNEKMTPPAQTENENVSLKESLLSILCMPGFLFVLFSCTFLGMAWYSFYYIYLTDFLGKVVYGGDPSAQIGSHTQRLYIKGVRVGSLCMSIDSVAAVVHALITIKLVDKFGIKPLYVGGQALGTLAMIMIASIHNPVTVYVMSILTGVQYSTIQTFPYMLLVQYHKAGLFKDGKCGRRGLGTDMALFTMTLSLSQFFGSFLVGTLLKVLHTMAVAMWCAAGASFLGMIVALWVRYPEDDEDEADTLTKNEVPPASEEPMTRADDDVATPASVEVNDSTKDDRS